jgi:hypothetical protein
MLLSVLVSTFHMQACDPNGNNGKDAGGGDDAGIVHGDYLSQDYLSGIAAFLSADEQEGREEGSAGHAASRNFLINKLSACGINPAGTRGYEQAVTTGIGINVLGTIEGTDATLKDRYVLISAHYDHLGTSGSQIYNGAGDNASAVAIVTGIACAISKTPLKRSVLVALWDSEEPPTYMTSRMGSEFFAANPIVPLANIDVAIALDLTGIGMWPGYQGHFVMGSEYSDQIKTAVEAAAAPSGLLARPIGLHLVESQVTGGIMRWSDHAAFIARNIPVLFVSDGTNKNYHKPTDTFDTLDLDKLVKEAIYLHAIVEQIALISAPTYFNSSGADYLRDANGVIELLEAALGSNGLVDSIGLGTTSRSSLIADLSAARAVQQKLSTDQTATNADIRVLRTAAQRVMCLAGTMYPETSCNQF